MANAALKLTMEFKDLRGGWSESYYLAQPAQQTIKTIVDKMVEYRAAVLGSGVSIVLVRAGMTDKPRSMQRFRKSQNGAATDITGSNKGTIRRADARDTTLLSPYRTTAGTLRYVTIGGFPDAWIDRANDNEDFLLTDVGTASANVFYDQLLTPPYALLIRERLRVGDTAPKVVNNIAQHTDGKYKVTTAVAHGLVSGDKVVLTGLKGANLQNAHGTRKVADVVDANNFTIDRGPRADLPDVDLTVNAAVSKVGYSYEQAISTAESYVVTTRRRGRGFAQRRGRRSASK